MMTPIPPSPPRLALLLALLFAGLAAQRTHAEVLVDIYTATVSVDSRSERSVAAARREGLERVLVKASGDAAAAQRPEVAAALEDAQRYLQRYSYVDTPGGEVALRLDYDDRAVQDLLRSAGLPLWTSNRPPVLAWLVVSDGARRRFLSADDAPDAVAALRRRFDDRGLPLQLPLYDLTDTAALSPGEAWRQSSSALVEASRRYRGSELLAGRAARTATGRWVGDWQLLYEGRWVRRRVDVDSFDAFAEAAADLAASAIAGRYAVALSGGADLRHRVTLRGIRGYAEFSAARAALESLAGVRRVVPERLIGDQVSLRIEADADLVQLARIVELDQRFVPTPATAGDTGLFYEWIR
ncbi:MAG: DUF2066 domain-containing protein [Halieaceae bacterium]|jgi:hypothetical protein|nr:DUF2066 domain-containing protein [Halieaceae bacterium]